MSSLDSLQALEQALRDGQVARALERSQLGSALQAATIALEAFSVHVEALKQLDAGARLVGKTLASSAIEQLRVWLKGIVDAGKQVEQARDTAQLAAVPQCLQQAYHEIDRTSDTLQRGWESLVRSTFPSFKQLGEILSGLPDTERIGNAIRDNATRGEALATQSVRDEKVVQMLQQCEAEQQRLRRQLAESRAGEDLVNFLLRVVDSAATLEHLTEEVRSQLEQWGALPRLKVRFE